MRKYIRAVATAVLAVIVSGATLSVFAATSVCTPEQLAAITPIVTEEKYNAASYPAFDFTNTWSIAEGTEEPRLLPLNGFTTFLDDCYLPLNTDPETVNADGATVTVLATEDLADWSGAKLVPMAYDASDGTWKPEIVERPPRLFFKWRISFDW